MLISKRGWTKRANEDEDEDDQDDEEEAGQFEQEEWWRWGRFQREGLTLLLVADYKSEREREREREKIGWRRKEKKKRVRWNTRRRHKIVQDTHTHSLTDWHMYISLHMEKECAFFPLLCVNTYVTWGDVCVYLCLWRMMKMLHNKIYFTMKTPAICDIPAAIAAAVNRHRFKTLMRMKTNLQLRFIHERSLFCLSLWIFNIIFIWVFCQQRKKDKKRLEMLRHWCILTVGASIIVSITLESNL